MDDKQAQFLQELEEFIKRTELRSQFRGRAKVLRSLKRIKDLAVFK